MKSEYREYIIGILFAVAVSAVSVLLSPVIPGVGAVTIAIVIGLIAGNFTGVRKQGRKGISLFENKALPIAIALMGFELQLSTAEGIGGTALFVVPAVIVSSLLLGVLFARFSPLPGKMALLLGVGNGICGSAAIAACAPVIDADEDDVGISVAVINLLGAAAIFVFPWIVQALHLDQEGAALLTGGTIQAVGQTLAAALQMDPEVGRLAMVVKMGRVLMLGFVVILLAALSGKKRSGRFPLPLFIAGFILFALMVNIMEIPESILHVIDLAKKALLYPAMAAIGMGIDLKSIGKFGPGAFAAGLAIFLWNIGLVLVAAALL